MPWTWTPIVYTWLALTAAGLALLPPRPRVHHPQRRPPRRRRSTSSIPTPSSPPTSAPPTPNSSPPPGFPSSSTPSSAKESPSPASPSPSPCSGSPTLPPPSWAATPSPCSPSSASSSPPQTRVPHLARSRLRWASREARPLLPTPIRHPLQLAATTTAGTLLGLGLAAFYILPAAYERRYVQIAMAILPGTAHPGQLPLPPHRRHPIHDAVLHTASIIAVVLLALTAIAIAIAALVHLHRQKPGCPILRSLIAKSGIRRLSNLLPLAILTIVIAFLLTPLSRPIWQHPPELAFLQFPWRLLAILAASPWPRHSLSPYAPLKLKSTASRSLVPRPRRSPHLPRLSISSINTCYPEDTVTARLALFRSNTGTEPNDEYTPIAADNDALAPDQPTLLARSTLQHINANAPANVQLPARPHHSYPEHPHSRRSSSSISATTPPGASPSTSTTVTTRLHRNDGLIAIPRPCRSQPHRHHLHPHPRPDHRRHPHPPSPSRFSCSLSAATAPS